MSEAEEIWINLPRSSDEYINGVKNFVKNVMAKYAVGAELKCPCGNFNSKMWWAPDDVFNHLVCKGHSLDVVKWIYDVSNLGDTDVRDCEINIGFEDNHNQMLNLTYTNREPNSDARKFYRLVEDGKRPLYPGSKKISRLSFLIRLYHWKCLNGVTQTAFGEILQLLKEAFPDIEIPTSFNFAKNIIRDLRLDYQKIHACPNDYMLYCGKNQNEVSCNTCGVSRWRDTEEEHKKDQIPAKVMRYFPLKPRLQRMYMCKEFTKLMNWHVVDRKKDGMLRHRADGIAWKTIDAKYPTFSSENQNIRLGIASDGFNPFGIMSGNIEPGHLLW
ncbi:uncharacterized protein LOC141695802 [Apium graveolens]|uniref:uncharacterized protein LOC141695802 n=1 Tax=Apium graveolens TaxID=4045 RepID=UPI003D7B50EC